MDDGCLNKLPPPNICKNIFWPYRLPSLTIYYKTLSTSVYMSGPRCGHAEMATVDGWVSMFLESLQSAQFLTATEREMCIGKMEKMSSISSLMFWQLNSSLGSSECFIRRLAGEIVSAWPPLLVSSLSPSHADTAPSPRLTSLAYL